MKPRLELYSLREEIRKLDAAWDATVVEGEFGDSVDQGRQLEVLADMRALLVEHLAELAVDLHTWASEKDSLADRLEVEAKKFHAAAVLARDRAKRARETLLAAMLEQGMTVIEGERFVLKVQDGPPAVVQDPGVELQLLDLPDHFLRFKDPELDRVAIKAALKAGEEVRGFRLESRPQLRARVRA